MEGNRRKSLFISIIIVTASLLVSYVVVNLDVVKTNTNHGGETWSGTIDNGTNRFAFGGDHNWTTDTLVTFSVQGNNGSLLIMDAENYQESVHNESFSFSEALSQRNISNGNVTFTLPAGYYWINTYVGNSVPITFTVLLVSPQYEYSYPLLWLGVIISLVGTGGAVCYYVIGMRPPFNTT